MVSLVNKKTIEGYVFEELIGSGVQSRVYSAEKDGKKYAIKELRCETEKEKRLLKQEEKNFVKLKDICPYLLNFVESFEKDDVKYFVMELCEGTLTDMINVMIKFKFSIKEERVWKFISQIFIGLAVMHKKNIIHRDIKDGNIFIDDEGNLKLGDFGISKEILSESHQFASNVGTFQYTAPEVMIDSGKYSFQCDVWSAGIVMYKVVEGVLPFDGSPFSLCKKICDEPFPPMKNEYSPKLKETIGRMLEKKPSQRITVEEVLLIKEVQNFIKKNELFIPDFLKPSFLGYKIIVKFPSKKEIPFEVKGSDTISSLKKRIRPYFDDPILYYEETLLEVDYTFDYYNIKENSVLYLIPFKGPYIYVKTLEGKIFTIPRINNMTIYQVKLRIRASTGLCMNDMRLICNYRESTDEATLEDYNFPSGGTMNLVVVTKGG